jgi:hypothetical protein
MYVPYEHKYEHRYRYRYQITQSRPAETTRQLSLCPWKGCTHTRAPLIVLLNLLVTLHAQIPRVNILDELELRDIFFGEGGTGKSYAVLCLDEESTLPISSVFQDAYNDGSAPAEFRLLDCNYVLPDSEKSIAERFKLDLKNRPTIFVSGTIGAPQQVSSKYLKTGPMFVKMLRGKLEVRAAKIETTQDLRVKCLDKDICGLLLKGAKTAPGYLKDAMNKLLKEFPNVAFASVDASVLYVKNLEEYLPELQDGQPRFVVFQKMSGSVDAGKDRLITSIAALPTNGVSYGQMSNLVAGVVSKTEKLTKVSALPMIKTRSKKLEEEERAKRERKLDQQRRQQSGQSDGTTPGGAFSANDGSRDGRRAERDRRRNDHRTANNVQDKTPEQLAEMERQRSIRMEEEAKKWNMAPDDAPDEGSPAMDDDIMEDYTETIVEDLDEDKEDGEDVLDLD